MSDQPIAKVSAPRAEEKAWLQFVREEQQKAPARMEEAAKYLAAIISISLTLFINKRPEGLSEWMEGILYFSGVLWVLSALLSLFVLFPAQYTFVDQSPDSIQQTFSRITKRKRAILFIAVCFYVVALGIGAFVLLSA